MTVQWEKTERQHDGSAECPADARDVPCAIHDKIYGWMGQDGGRQGESWYWDEVDAYRLPVTAPDTVRGALVEACQAARDWFRGGNQTVQDICNQLDAALTSYKEQQK